MKTKPKLKKVKIPSSNASFKLPVSMMKILKENNILWLSGHDGELMVMLSGEKATDYYYTLL